MSETMADRGRALERRARAAGVFVQGLVLGVLLFFALARLFALAEGAQVFRYQAF